jgi:hypothetical protein
LYHIGFTLTKVFTFIKRIPNEEQAYGVVYRVQRVQNFSHLLLSLFHFCVPMSFSGYVICQSTILQYQPPSFKTAFLEKGILSLSWSIG